MGLWFEHALLAEGWTHRVRVEVDDGVVRAINAGVEARPGDERGGIAIPGLPNLHSHAFQRAMAGLAEVRGPSSDSFWTWRELMYRFVGDLGPEDVEAIAAQAFLEMLEGGFTRVGEFHYLHHAPDGGAYADPGEMAARIAAAAAETGIGLTLLPVFYAHSGFGGAAPLAGQRRFVNSLDGYGRLQEASRAAVKCLADAVVGVAPHSLRAVTEDELRVVSEVAGPIHIHIAEQLKEVADCLAWSAARPVEWLQGRFAVDDRWCLVHATHMSEAEQRRLAAEGAVVGLCPITEANLGDGVFPAAEHLMEDGEFGVGSDSNVRIDAAEELRLLEYGQRLMKRSRNVLARREGEATGALLYRRALTGGAQALGVPQGPGLAVGASADIVSFPNDHETLVARADDAWLDSWIFAAAPVEHVWRRGRRVVADGRHHARERITARYRGVLERLLRK